MPVQNRRVESRLTIKRVETRDQLNTCLDAGLAQLYREVFAEPPWREDFSLDESRQGFRDYFDDGGTIFVAEDAGKPVAFVVSVPLTKVFNGVRQVGDAYTAANDVDVNKTAYFAEDGVDKAYRGQGLSGRLKEMLLEANRRAGFGTVLLRTGEESYVQISAVNKAGGAILSGVFQQVASKRTDGEMRSDRRLYYVFDEQTRKTEVDIVNAVVTRGKTGDTVVVSQAMADDLAARLKAVYPAVRKIRVAEKEPRKNVVFKGRLYVSRLRKYAA